MSIISTATRRTATSLHATVGATLAILFYTIFLAGTFAQLEDDMTRYEHAAYRGLPTAPVASYDALVKRVRGAATAPGDTLLILPASSERPYVEVRGNLAGLPGSLGDSRVRYNTVTGEQLPYHGFAAARFIRNLHSDLLLPAPWGRILMGLLGIMFLGLIVTGLVQRPNLRASLKRVPKKLRGRPLRAFRHRRAGYLASPYAVVLAISGIVLGLSAIPWPDTSSRVEPHSTDAGPAPTALDLDAAVAEVRSAYPGGDLRAISLSGLGTAAPEATLVVRARQNWMIDRSYRYALGPARMISTESAADTGPGAVIAFMTPLHYGTYLGWWSKALHIAVGLALVTVSVHGVRMWAGDASNRRSVAASVVLAYLWALPLALAGSIAMGQVWKTEGDRAGAFAAFAAAILLIALAASAIRARVGPPSAQA